MSQIIAKIAFYDILKCGYFNVQDRNHAFCSTYEMLQGLHQWTKGKNIGQTITFSPEEDSQQSNIYCYDMQCGNDKSAVLITWNDYNVTDDNIISAINGTKPVGNNDIKTSQFTEEYIPGFPTYFWFPNHNKDIFATVRFEQRYNGRKDMCSYIEAFLASKHPKYVFRVSETDDSLCYGKDDTDSGDYIPSFLAKPARLPGRIQYIRASRTKITKLRHQSELRTTINAGDKTIWQKLSEKLGSPSPAVREHPINYDVTLDWTPSRKELEEIIDKWTLDREDVGRVGVVLKGDSANTHWFDTCLAKTEFQIEVERNSSGFISAASLLNALNQNKESILAKSYAE
jgi:hypothetical protein